MQRLFDKKCKDKIDKFTGTRALTQALDLEALERWLSAHVDGFAGPLSIEQFKGGKWIPIADAYNNKMINGFG